MPAADHAVSIAPWIAPTWTVPNRSRKYAGIVAKPPPYMLMMTRNAKTNSTMLCDVPEGRDEHVQDPHPG